MVSAELIQLLRCPKCHGTLQHVSGPAGFHCSACRLVYLIEQEIPNFLIEDAQPDSILQASGK